MRKRTRRKVYALVNPIQHAIEGAAITPQAELDRLRARELAAIDCFARGAASEVEWHDLNAMVGICETMAERGIGPEALSACKHAFRFLAVDLARYKETGRMGTTGPGLQAYREAFEYHDLQRQSVSRSEYERAIKSAIARVRFTKAAA